jgi:hypothetical protein
VSLQSHGVKIFAALHFVCFWHKADITIVLNHVCFRGKADMTPTEPVYPLKEDIHPVVLICRCRSEPG